VFGQHSQKILRFELQLWSQELGSVLLIGQEGMAFKLKEGLFRLDVRKNFFTQKVVRCLNRLPRETVDVPYLEASKARLDGILAA